MECKFMNISMRVGDELNKRAYYDNAKCIKCVCEVPPTPTCVFFTDAADCALIENPNSYANLTETQNSGWYHFEHKRKCTETKK